MDNVGELVERAVETMRGLSPGTRLLRALDTDTTALLMVVPLPAVKIGGREFFNLELAVVYHLDTVIKAVIRQPDASLLGDVFGESSGAIHPHVYDSGSYCIAPAWAEEIINNLRADKPALAFFTAVKATASLNPSSQTRQIPRLSKCIVCGGYHGDPNNNRTIVINYQDQRGPVIGPCLGFCDLSNQNFGRPELKQFVARGGRTTLVHASYQPVECLSTGRIYDKRQAYTCPASGRTVSPYNTVNDTIHWLMTGQYRQVSHEAFSVHLRLNLPAVLMMLKPGDGEGLRLRYEIVADYAYSLATGSNITPEFQKRYLEYVNTTEWKTWEMWVYGKEKREILNVMFPAGWQAFRHQPTSSNFPEPQTWPPRVEPVTVTLQPPPVNYIAPVGVRTSGSGYAEERYLCADCDEYHDESNIIWLHNGTTVCHGCYDNGPYEQCGDCEDYFHETEINHTHGGDAVCDGCLEGGPYASCDSCGHLYRNEEVNWCEEYDIYLCDGCSEEALYYDSYQKVVESGVYRGRDLVSIPNDVDADLFDEIMSVSLPYDLHRGDEVASSLAMLITEFEDKLYEVARSAVMGSEVPEND